LKRYGSHASSVSLTPSYILSKIVLLLLLAASVALVLGSHREKTYASTFQASVSDALTPVMSLISQPVDSIRQLSTNIGQFFAVYEQNQFLLAENEALRKWQMLASQLQEENTELRQLLNAAPALSERRITARVIGESSAGFSRSVLVNAGATNGISKGQTVVNKEGIVGRITTVGQFSARALLLNDAQSSIPVQIGEAKARAILTGTNESLPIVQYLPPESSIKAGDMIFTSGHGGLFAKGLPVGHIAYIASDGTAHVRPLANLDALQFVTVIERPSVAPPEVK